MSQVSDYTSILYPKGAGSLTENILPLVKDNSLATHQSDFGSKKVGGTIKRAIGGKNSRKRKNKLKRTVIRRRKGSSRRKSMKHKK